MQKVAFLDRDGVINVDHGYVHDIKDWAFTSRAPEAMRWLQELGFTLAIATGQSGIGRGKYTEENMHVLHMHMCNELKKHGVTLSAIAFCPHVPEDNCNCRKPRPGMAHMIRKIIGPIDFAQSIMVGDKPCDVGFGKSVRCATFLIRSRYWGESDLNTIQPDHVCESLFEVAQILTPQV